MQSRHAAIAAVCRIGLYQGQGPWSARPPLRRSPFGEDTTLVVGSQRFAGVGWLTTEDAAQRWRQLPEPEMPSRTARGEINPGTFRPDLTELRRTRRPASPLASQCRQNPRRPARRYERLPSMPQRGAGVHQARVSHLIGAPCGTTAPAGPHRLMPVLVLAVVPLVPSNKANESSLHGGAFLTEPTLRIQASEVHDEARSRAGRSVGCRHACLPNCLPIGSTWSDQAGTQADARYARRSCETRADLG